MIVVTGASRGIGKAIKEHLTSKDIEVVGLARHGDPLQQILECDVSDHAAVKAVVSDLKQRKAPLAGLVHAAGIASMNLAITTPEHVTRRIVETNLMGTIFTNQLFAPMMVRSGAGRIVNFSTIAVKLGLKGESVYVASKAGVEAFTRAFAREVSAFAITVNCVAPGPIATDLLRGTTEEQIEDITRPPDLSQYLRRSGRRRRRRHAAGSAGPAYHRPGAPRRGCMSGILAALERRWGGLDHPFMVRDSHSVYFRDLTSAETTDLSDVRAGDVVALNEVRAVIDAGGRFQPMDCWLTFDDGYADHFDYVFPVLQKYGVRGSFYPPVLSTLGRDVLDVNKIHFVLVSCEDTDLLLHTIRDQFEDLGIQQKSGKSFDDTVAAIEPEVRFDTTEVIQVKRLLQRELPEAERAIICDTLFRRFVSDDPRSFASELYMNLDQLRQLVEAGHEIGSQGHDHLWLGHLPRDAQQHDLTGALTFWREHALLDERWTMAYAYGSYNPDTLSLLRQPGLQRHHHHHRRQRARRGLSALGTRPLAHERLSDRSGVTEVFAADHARPRRRVTEPPSHPC